MQSENTENPGPAVYRAENESWVLETYALSAVDPFAVLRAIPPHKSFAFWKGPDAEGGEFVIGVGGAMRINRAPGKGSPSASVAKLVRQARAMLTTPFVDPKFGLRAFFSMAFDPAEGFDERWRGYAPVEVFVPDVLLRMSPSGSTMTVFAERKRFETQRDAAAALLVAPGDGVEVRTLGEKISDDEAYEAAVAQTLARIDAGDATKIVVARTLDVSNGAPFDISGIVARLAGRFPECFTFAMRPGGSHRGAAPTFLGATPERLVAVEGGVLRTGALAGSAPRGVSAAMDERHAMELLTSDKERREHELVSEMIESTIAPICSSTHLGSVGVKKLGNVQHLYSPIEGILRGSEAGILDAVDLLHPTPAVCGEPREAARQAIREVEGFRRGLYAGAIGWIDLDGGDGDVAVAIRSALIDTNEARLFAGAGIVEGSDPRREARETRMKFNAVLEAL